MHYMVVYKRYNSTAGNIAISTNSSSHGVITTPYVDRRNNFIFCRENSLRSNIINILYTTNNIIDWNRLNDRSYFHRNLLGDFILDENKSNEVLKHYYDYLYYFANYKDTVFKILINDNYKSLTDQEFFDHIDEEIDNYFTLKEII